MTAIFSDFTIHDIHVFRILTVQPKQAQVSITRKTVIHAPKQLRHKMGCKNIRVTKYVYNVVGFIIVKQRH